MPESSRKRRQRRKTDPNAALTEAIREVLDTHSGATLAVHEAGAYETLSFEVGLPEDTSDGMVVTVANRLLDAVDSSAEVFPETWEWMMSIHRGGEAVLSLEAGADRQVTCPMCGRIQNRGGNCEACLTALPS